MRTDIEELEAELATRKGFAARIEAPIPAADGRRRGRRRVYGIRARD